MLCGTERAAGICIEGKFFKVINFKLIKALFSEVNPIPVKAAMAAMGFCEDYLRLPLTPMEDAHKEVLLQCMREQGLNV